MDVRKLMDIGRVSSTPINEGDETNEGLAATLRKQKKFRQKGRTATGAKKKRKNKLRGAALAAFRRVMKLPSTMKKRLKTRKKRKRMVKGYGESVVQHDPAYVRAVVEYAAESGKRRVAAQLLGVDPRLTSTPTGVYAAECAGRVLENKLLKKCYQGLEYVDENTLAMYFDKDAKDLKGAIERILGEDGQVKLVANPGDTLDEGEASEFFIYFVKPNADVVEAIEEEQFERDFVDEADDEDDEADDEDEGEEEADDDEDDEGDVDEMMGGGSKPKKKRPKMKAGMTGNEPPKRRY